MSIPYKTDTLGRECRPNTQDTALKWRNDHFTGGSVLCLTNQPFVHYQTAVIRSVLGNEVDVMGAGPASEQQPLEMTLALDAIARLLYIAHFSSSPTPLPDSEQ